MRPPSVKLRPGVETEVAASDTPDRADPTIEPATSDAVTSDDFVEIEVVASDTPDRADPTIELATSDAVTSDDFVAVGGTIEASSSTATRSTTPPRR